MKFVAVQSKSSSLQDVAHHYTDDGNDDDTNHEEFGDNDNGIGQSRNYEEKMTQSNKGFSFVFFFSQTPSTCFVLFCLLFWMMLMKFLHQNE